jgi:hypothetical protein
VTEPAGRAGHERGAVGQRDRVVAGHGRAVYGRPCRPGRRAT